MAVAVYRKNHYLLFNWKWVYILVEIRDALHTEDIFVSLRKEHMYLNMELKSQSLSSVQNCYGMNED